VDNSLSVTEVQENVNGGDVSIRSGAGVLIFREHKTLIVERGRRGESNSTWILAVV